MTNHTPVSSDFSRNFADEVFAEMSRKRYAIKDLAEALDVTAHTAGTRINGKVPFNAPEMSVVAAWLNVSLTELVSRAKLRTEAVAA